MLGMFRSESSWEQRFNLSRPIVQVDTSLAQKRDGCVACFHGYVIIGEVKLEKTSSPRRQYFLPFNGTVRIP